MAIDINKLKKNSGLSTSKQTKNSSLLSKVKTTLTGGTKAKNQATYAQHAANRYKETITPAATHISVPAPGSRKAKEQVRQVLLTGKTGANTNTYTEDYLLSMPGVGPLLAKAKPQLAQNAVAETEKLFNQHPTYAGFMENLNPAGSTKNAMERNLGQNIDTVEAESTLPYKVGSFVGAAGQYLMTGGTVEGTLTKSLTKKLIDKGVKGAVKRKLLATTGANLAAGAPFNTVQSIDQSKQDDGTYSGKTFAANMAINEALDVALGGAIEGVSAIRRFKKLSKAGQSKVVDEVVKKTGASKDQVNQYLLPEPAVNWDYGTYKAPDYYVSPGGHVSSDINKADTKLLAAPDKTFVKKESPISKNTETAKKFVDRPGVDKVKAKAETYNAITKELGITSKEDRELLAETMRHLDSKEKDGWDTDVFWDTIKHLAKKQTVKELDPESLYPGLKKELRETAIKISDDVKQVTDFNKLRKQNIGKVKFSKAGRSADQYYNSLSERYPDLFPENVTNQADQVKRIIDVANALKPIRQTVGDTMTDDDLWRGPLGKVWGAAEKYRKATKQEIEEAVETKSTAKFKKPEGLEKRSRSLYDIAKGQKEVPKTVTKSEYSGKPKNADLPKKNNGKAELPKEPLKRVELPKTAPRKPELPKKNIAEVKKEVPQEVKNDKGRGYDNRSEAKPDSKTERVLENLHRNAEKYRGTKTDGGRYYEPSTGHPAQKQINELSKAFGADVVFVHPATKDVDFFNGTYLKTKDAIVISDTSENPANIVLGHELMHRVKAQNPNDFKKFQDVVIKELKGKKYADYVQEMKSVAKDLGEEYSSDDIMEEYIADFSGEMFNNPKIMQRIFEDDRSLAKRIYDIISDMIVSLRKPLSRAYVVSDSIKNLKKVQDEYVNLMQRARKNGGLLDQGTTKFSLKRNQDSPEFKRDARKFLDGEPVVTLKGDEFPKQDGYDLATRVEAYYQLKYKGKVINPEIGEVILNRRGIKDSIMHGIGQTKAAAFKAVPDIIEKGKVINYQQNWKGRNYDSYVISAPLKIGADDYIGAVVAIRKGDRSRFYIHEAYLKKKLDLPFSPGLASKGVSGPGGNQVSIQSILSDIFNVNSEEPTKFSLKRNLPNQEISSADTSLNQVPALHKTIKFEPGSRNFDYGGGKYNTATQYLKRQDVENLVYDRFNRSTDHNDSVLFNLEKKPADTATISNVLNVIKEKENREFVLRDAANYVKPDGKIYISVYEGNGSGIGKETTKGWQNNRATADYMEEISDVFGAGSVTRKGKTIIVDLSGYDRPKFSLKREEKVRLEFP